MPVCGRLVAGSRWLVEGWVAIVKALPADLLESEPGIPWREITRMRDHLALRYFDTNHAVVQATVDQDLAGLDLAVLRLVERLGRGDPKEG
jgi:uncharacterized protein with HEPN domain